MILIKYVSVQCYFQSGIYSSNMSVKFSTILARLYNFAASNSPSADIAIKNRSKIMNKVYIFNINLLHDNNNNKVVIDTSALRRMTFALPDVLLFVCLLTCESRVQQLS